MVETHVLDDEGNQALDCARTESLNASSTQMRSERSAETGPDTASNGDDAAAENDGSAADGDGERNEEEVGDANHEHGQRGEEIDVPDRRLSLEQGQILERVGSLRQAAGLDERGQQHGGVERRVGVDKGKDGQHGAQDELGGGGHGAEEAEEEEGDALARHGQVERVLGVVGRGGLADELAVAIHAAEEGRVLEAGHGRAGRLDVLQVGLLLDVGAARVTVVGAGAGAWLGRRGRVLLLLLLLAMGLDDATLPGGLFCLGFVGAPFGGAKKEPVCVDSRVARPVGQRGRGD